MECFTFQCHCEGGAYFTVYGYTLLGAHAIGNYTHTLGEAYSTEGLYELAFDSAYSVFTGALTVGNTVYVSRRNSATNFASWVRSYDATTGTPNWTEETANGLSLPIENAFRVTGAPNAINENEVFASYESGRLLLDAGGQTVYQSPLTTIENEQWRFDLFASHDYPSCGATRVRLVEFTATMVNVTTSPSGFQWRHTFEFEWTVKVAVEYGQGEYDPSSRRPTATSLETVLYEMPAPRSHFIDVATGDQDPPAEPPGPTAESLNIRFGTDTGITTNAWVASRWVSFSGYEGDWAGVMNFDREGVLLYAGGPFGIAFTPVRSPFYPNTYRKLWIGGEAADAGQYAPPSSGIVACAVAPRSSADSENQTTYVARYLSSSTSRLDVYHGDAIGYSSPPLSGSNLSGIPITVQAVSADWAIVRYTADIDTIAPDGRDWSRLSYFVQSNTSGTGDDSIYFWFVHRSNGEWQPWRWEDPTKAGEQYIAPFSQGSPVLPQGLSGRLTLMGDMVKTSVPDSDYGPPQSSFGIDPP